MKRNIIHSKQADPSLMHCMARNCVQFNDSEKKLLYFDKKKLGMILTIPNFYHVGDSNKQKTCLFWWMIKGDEVGVTIPTIHSEKLAPHTHHFRDEFTKHHYSFRMLGSDSKHVHIIVNILSYI